MTSPEESFIRHWLTLPDRPDIEEDELPLFMDWLEQSGPDEWHRWATSWNWGHGIDLLFWVIEQDRCDRGTALSVYYLAQPDFYARFDTIEAALKSGDGDAVDLMVAICRNWAAGLYRDYAFEPADVALEYMNQGPAAMRDLAGRLPWDMPDDMAAAPIQGVPNMFERTIDGVPLAMLQAKQACGLEPDVPDYV